MAVSCEHCQGLFSLDQSVASMSCCPKCGTFIDDNTKARVLTDALVKGDKVSLICDLPRTNSDRLREIMYSFITHLLDQDIIAFVE